MSTEMDGSKAEMGLSQMEKGLLTSLSRVELRGKNTRGVPVLLTQGTKEALQLIVAKRHEGNVAKGNALIVFACNGRVLSI